MKRTVLLSAAGLFAAAFLAFPQAQKFSDLDRERSRMMLKMIHEDVKKEYYDPTFHGVDIDKVFRDAEEQIKQSNSMNRSLGIIAAALDSLNDSHTFFIPPPRPYRHDYGWEMAMVGDQCFITAVRPGSDAEAKGVKPGDELLSVNDYVPSRDLLWKMRYVLNALRPQPSLRLTLRSPAGQPHTLEVVTRMKQGKLRVDLAAGEWFDLIREAENQNRLLRQRTQEQSDLFIWKMPQFDMTETAVDDMMGKVRKHKALILDLRGNPGGVVDTLNRLIGHFFEHDIKVGDWTERKKKEPHTAKARGKNPFTGKLIVLVDSGSASAAEIFARVMQIEKRGTVLGDRSSGSVMVSQAHGHQVGVQDVVPFAASITHADLIMTDGKSLEHTGVMPDERLLPTGSDLAKQHDPVLSRAAELLGYKLSPEDAGKLFPIEWRKA